MRHASLNVDSNVKSELEEDALFWSRALTMSISMGDSAANAVQNFKSCGAKCDAACNNLLEDPNCFKNSVDCWVSCFNDFLSNNP